MNEKHHKQRQTLLEESHYENRDLSNEPAKLHSQTIGSGGPVLEQDGVLHETLQEFIHEKILERPVHAKGFGAFGYFQTIYSMSEHTKLSFLQNSNQRVPVMVRFSLTVGTKGTPDTSRNVRGLATKFYTEEGVFELLCNHIPVFSVRDAIRFPEFIKALLPSPKNNLIDPDRFWNFVARAPESIHFVVRLYSDAGTVKSLRHIPGHSVNTYVWRNAQGIRKYVKYHWYPFEGVQYIGREEANRLAAENPDNYMEQVEKVAFSVSNLLDGAELSDDKILQGRANIYSDSQRRRIGAEFRKLSVNQQQNWTPANQITSGDGRYVEGKLERTSITKQDDFGQAGEFYTKLTQIEKEHLVENLASDLKVISDDIRKKVMEYFNKVSSDLAKRIEIEMKK
ncbi:catalase [Microbacteriaceae bacterium 4G12]